MIDSKGLESFRSALEALHEKLSTLVSDSAEGARPVDLEEPIGRISRGDAMQQQKMVAENRQAAQQRRRQVEAALARIDDGEYGECLGCGEEIDPRRLEAQPEAALCVACQGQREKRG
jgi:DnaK suppressor protein